MQIDNAEPIISHHKIPWNDKKFKDNLDNNKESKTETTFWHLN